jgi:hypothetical protein
LLGAEKPLEINASIKSTPPDAVTQVKIWRTMISQIANEHPIEKGFTNDQVSAAIQAHADFQTLKPFLSAHAQAELSRAFDVFPDATIQSVLVTLQHEVDRIGHEWKEVENK